MPCSSTSFKKPYFFGILIIILFFNNLLIYGTIIGQSEDSSQNAKIRIINEEIPLFGGINSIRASIGSSTMAVLFRTSDNPQPLYLFTQFSQKIAKVQILNRRGTIINQTQLTTQNTFVIALNSIIEFEVKGNNSFYNPQGGTSVNRMIDLSKVMFRVHTTKNVSNNSENELNYQVQLIASNISYEQLLGFPATSSLDNLSFSFVFQVRKDIVQIPKIPVVSIRPTNNRLEVVKTVQSQNLQAMRFSPRLKFSCNISGWNFSSPNSKLLLRVDIFTREQITSLFNPIAGFPVIREIFKPTNILGRLKFETNQASKKFQYNLDHNDNQTTNFTDHRFTSSGLSLGSSLRNFLNVSWDPTVLVDDITFPVIFYPISSGERQMIISKTPLQRVPVVYLLGGFVFPQGSEIHYDPEILLEELNPQLNISPVPNRSIIQESSLIILISGFFVGIIVILRSRSLK
ncbi:MAG: hypothetical protein ACXAC8_14920 [Candidatus Hodarchaeales archaeon]|jgi:hypothetical protein